jgi:hypothetical protein
MSHTIVVSLNILAIMFYFGGTGVLFYWVYKFSSRSNPKQSGYSQFWSTGFLLMAGGLLCETMVKSDLNGRLEVGLPALLFLVICVPWSELKLPGSRNRDQIIEAGSSHRSAVDPDVLR